MTEQIILTDIHAYYDEHIKGHTPGELEVGNTFCIKAYNEYLANENLVKDRYETPDDYLMSDEFIQRCIDLSSLTRDQVTMTIDLAQAFSFYSDWHKDEYGFRPRSL